MNSSSQITPSYHKLELRLVVPLAIALASLIAISGYMGYPYLTLVVLAIFSLPVLVFPIFIPVIVIVISPLLGQTTSYTIGSLNSIGILSLWFMLLGGVIVALNLGKILKNRLIIVSLLIIFLSILSLIPSNNLEATMTEALRTTSAMLMLPLVVILSKEQKHRKILIAAVVVSSFLPLIIGAYQKITGDLIIGGAVLTNYERETGLIRIYSTFYDAHPFAKYLIVLLSLLFAFILEQKKSPLTKYIYLILFGVGFTELLFTYARGQLISVIVSFVIIIYAARKLNIKLAILSLPVMVGLFSISGVFQRFSDLTQQGVRAPGLQPNSLVWRLQLWERAIPLSLSRPILGHGLGTFDAALGIIAHNDYLGFFYELGIGGLVLYIMFLFIAARITWRNIRINNIWNFDRIIALAGLGATFAIAVSSIAENIFTSTTMWWNYMVLLGCVIAAEKEWKIRIYAKMASSEQ